MIRVKDYRFKTEGGGEVIITAPSYRAAFEMILRYKIKVIDLPTFKFYTKDGKGFYTVTALTRHGAIQYLKDKGLDLNALNLGFNHAEIKASFKQAEFRKAINSHRRPLAELFTETRTNTGKFREKLMKGLVK